MAGGTVVVLGEVHTGLVQHSGELPPAQCERVLRLLEGERVHGFQRPIAYAVSPPVLTGVDCSLATGSGATPRGVGSVEARAGITGGRVLQGRAVAAVVRATATRRLPWAHYLARPGRVEAIGRCTPEALATGFLAAPAAPSTLDLTAIAGRIVDEVQASPVLDRRPPLRVARTRLRWAVEVTDAAEPELVRLAVEPNHRRTVLMRAPGALLGSIAEFCADLALHDWLLTTLLGVVERSRMGAGHGSEVVERLRPAVQHLLHLWMPVPRADPVARALWVTVERLAGVERQWEATRDRIRDQVALSNLTLLMGGVAAGATGVGR
ncbi:SCO2521 family protein [Rhizomonospora bruguierae]|uniref:SCO2521 family protein n=1 Tax=Rhizomonospora bruguierae TaxID=1581705 RepID=UPI001BCDCB76|nr:SCO2521 family protein [Micromonospora sp. NBRC 107566]